MKKLHLFALLFFGFLSISWAQSNHNQGIHVSGGCSYDSIVSSNIGTSCNATGRNSFAGGYYSTASGRYSFAFGENAQATRENAYAMGHNALAEGLKSVSLGFDTQAQHSNSIVIGSGYGPQNELSSVNSGITMGVGSNAPTLFITAAAGTGNTGSVAIGNVTPHFKLHVHSDLNEDADEIRQQKEIDSLRTLVTVSFGYDACGNRISRTLLFSKGDPDAPSRGGTPVEDTEQWQASVSDSFGGAETSLFPNPTEGGFILSFAGETPRGAKAVLCTMDGKVVEERTVGNATEEFDLGGKPAGVYLLRLVSGRESKVWKVIKRN